ncbi:MAG: hypothetical protein QM612_09315 [Thermomonas sp.]|uniref:hypothetical protein n=1 Tax=Thermomonas sp. TaxID=1971895 RepID=UPI0039E4DA4C
MRHDRHTPLLAVLACGTLLVTGLLLVAPARTAPATSGASSYPTSGSSPQARQARHRHALRMPFFSFAPRG